MKALVSGQAGMAIVLGETPEFRPVHGDSYRGSESDVALTLAGYPDVETVEFDTIAALDRRAGRAWAEDRATYMLFMLLDRVQDEEEREEVAEEIVNLVTEYRIKRAMAARLGKIEPDTGQQERAQILADEFPGIAPFFSALYPGVQTGPDRVLFFDTALGRTKVTLVGAGTSRKRRNRLISKPKGLVVRAPSGLSSSSVTLQKAIELSVDRARKQLARGALAKRFKHLGHGLRYVDSKALEQAAERVHREIVRTMADTGGDTVAVPSLSELATMISNPQGKSGYLGRKALQRRPLRRAGAGTGH